MKKEMNVLAMCGNPSDYTVEEKEQIINDFIQPKSIWECVPEGFFPDNK